MDWTSAFYLLFLPFVCATFNLDIDSHTSFTQRQKSHKSKGLVSKKIVNLAQKSSKNHFIKDLLDPLLIERVVGSPGHVKAREHIVRFMTNLKWDVEEDQFEDLTPYGKKTFTNIIATRNKDAARRLVLACHYDSKYFAEFEFIGMTDSAVPCAMLLDIAEVIEPMMQRDRDSKASDVTLQLIFFDGEEAFKSWTATDSIYGARHLAKKMKGHVSKVYKEVPATDLQRMDVFVLLDLIGAANPTFRSFFPETDSLFQRLQKIEKRLAKENMLNHKNGNSNKYFLGSYLGGGGIEDDHKPFKGEGVSILHLICYPFPSVWHKESDNPQNFDYSATEDILKILRVFVVEYLHLSP